MPSLQPLLHACPQSVQHVFDQFMTNIPCTRQLKLLELFQVLDHEYATHDTGNVIKYWVIDNWRNNVIDCGTMQAKEVHTIIHVLIQQDRPDMLRWICSQRYIYASVNYCIEADAYTYSLIRSKETAYVLENAPIFHYEDPQLLWYYCCQKFRDEEFAMKLVNMILNARAWVLCECNAVPKEDLMHVLHNIEDPSAEYFCLLDKCESQL